MSIDIRIMTGSTEIGHQRTTRPVPTLPGHIQQHRVDLTAVESDILQYVVVEGHELSPGGVALAKRSERVARTQHSATQPNRALAQLGVDVFQGMAGGFIVQ